MPLLTTSPCPGIAVAASLSLASGTPGGSQHSGQPLRWVRAAPRLQPARVSGLPSAAPFVTARQGGDLEGHRGETTYTSPKAPHPQVQCFLALPLPSSFIRQVLTEHQLSAWPGGGPWTPGGPDAGAQGPAETGKGSLEGGESHARCLPHRGSAACNPDFESPSSRPRPPQT